MKVARLTSLFIPLALIGCANPRTFSSGGGLRGNDLFTHPLRWGLQRTHHCSPRGLFAG